MGQHPDAVERAGPLDGGLPSGHPAARAAGLVVPVSVARARVTDLLLEVEILAASKHSFRRCQGWCCRGEIGKRSLFLQGLSILTRWYAMSNK